MKPISECTVLITGATDGLGKMTAREFAQKGAKILLHGRNEEKGHKVLEEIKEATGNEELKYFNGDFSSLHSVNELAEEIMSNDIQLDILINNAGIGGGPNTEEERETSEDGFELRWAVNYLAPVLLTRKLLPNMKNGSRIINVASIGQAELDFNDLGMKKNYDGATAYYRSKSALIMFTFDLASELDEKDIKVNALHPSTLMNTKMVDKHYGYSQSKVEEGYEAIELLALSEDLENTTGKYFEGKKESDALRQAYDTNAREKLGKITEENLKGYI